MGSDTRPNIAARGVQRLEASFDAIFGTADNPLRHLGALGFYFFWLIVVTGTYLYVVLDTSVAGIYDSVEYLSREQPWLGGVMRSIHRYAADGFVIVMALHLLRELALGRFNGFRWFSWLTGVPVIWFAYASGIGGFWLVWDRLAQFSAIASMEWLDWLPIFAEPLTRNFLTPAAVTDRFFTLLVFLHIGIPLMLLLLLWVHIQRVSRADVFPNRGLAAGTLGALFLLSAVHPVRSLAPVDLATVAPVMELDWFYLFVHPLMYASSPGALWTLAIAATLLLAALPLAGGRRRPPVAVVDPKNCNGCSRCFADCPYAAVVMAPHPNGKPGAKIARVLPDLCAACGICAGACPSSTPFRSVEALVTGIDMPQQGIGALRAELERSLAVLRGGPKVVVFGCDCAAEAGRLRSPDTAVFSLLCTGLLPPSFVEYALRGGADGVFVTGCREGACAYRLGNTWTEERLGAQREPHLRPSVPRERLAIHWADASDHARLVDALEAFRQTLTRLDRERPSPALQPRRLAAHG